MNKNILSGSIIEQCDCNVIAFLDTSEYLGSVTNPILRIYPPNWSDYVNIEYNMNAITLIRPSHIKHNSLPSGVYHFTQSVCPNEKVFREFCYLNVCREYECLQEILCNSEDKEEKVFKLKMQLDFAQRLVQDCDTKRGLELYNTAVKEIQSLLKDNKCNNC